MTMTSTTATARPRRSVLDRATALRLAATEYGRYLDQLRVPRAGRLVPADRLPGLGRPGHGHP